MTGSNSKLVHLLKSWLPLAVAVTLLCGLIYVTVQQNYRMAANDPQIQMAEDTAAALAAGELPQSLVPATLVDIAKSLAPYLIVYDETGKPLAASARLDGKIPALPGGVFDYTGKHGEDRFSWQPMAGVRSAVVVAHYSGSQQGFVLAGRSLREVEIREDQLTKMVGIAWVITLLGTLTVNAFMVWITRN